MKKTLLGLGLGIFLSLGLVLLAGENPWLVLKVLLFSGFGSAYEMGQVIYYMSALIFTGLAVFIPLRAGLFNIGAEGQLTVGTLGMVSVGVLWPQLPGVLGMILSIVAGVLCAGLWGAVPGVLKVRRGSHEVIVTMMMNFVAAGLANYLITGPWQNPNSQNPETAKIPEAFQWTSWDPIHHWSPDSPANFSIVIGVGLCLLVAWWSRSTVSGFKQKVSSYNPEVAASAGINFRFYQSASLAVGGVFAGLVGLNEILGSVGQYRLGFSPELGFMGIAVALLARGRAYALILSALLFAILQKGAGDLDLETTHITRDFAHILQAIMILSLVAAHSFSKKETQK